MSSYAAPSVMFTSGEGCLLYDSDGKQYLDFLSGLAVVSLGHSHPKVADAVARQARKLQHVSNLFATEHNWKVAEKLSQLIGTPGQVFFCNSGAEANEAAIKLARRWAGHGRFEIISGFRSFHGRTLATLHATGQPEKHEPFQPLPEGFKHVPFGDIQELENAITERTAAVLLEPIMAEGGVIVPPEGYLQAVQEVCQERQILLIMDEVQTGLARTGRWFACQHEGIQPDVITMAKALGNGIPIGACWAKPEVAAAFSPGDHATTLGGQPQATAAAVAVLEVMEEMNAPSVVERLGNSLATQLLELPQVTEVRGRGLLLASELSPQALGAAGANETISGETADVKTAGVKTAGAAAAGEVATAGEVVAACMAEGLVLNAITPTAVRWAPPFVASEEQIKSAVEIFATVLEAGPASGVVASEVISESGEVSKP